jgi:hypothetical protein
MISELIYVLILSFEFFVNINVVFFCLSAWEIVLDGLNEIFSYNIDN